MSLSESDLKQLQVRNSYRRALRAIMETICSANADQLEPKLCEKANILRQPLSLDEDSNSSPIFFDRYEGGLEDLTDPEWDRQHPSTWEYESDAENHLNVQCLAGFMESYFQSHPPLATPGSYSLEMIRLNFGDLFETGGFFWKVTNTALALTNPESWPRSARGPNPPLPHIKCIIENDAMSDDRLLRGEITAIVKIMRGRLCAKSVRSHLMAPVLMVSAMGPFHVRVLEAYFDGNKLVVRNTKLYDARQDKDTVAADLCRWWYGKMKGNTTVLPGALRA